MNSGREALEAPDDPGVWVLDHWFASVRRSVVMAPADPAAAEEASSDVEKEEGTVQVDTEMTNLVASVNLRFLPVGRLQMEIQVESTSRNQTIENVPPFGTR